GQPSEQNSTFGNQDVLPRLPVPPLEETVCRFLEWTGPLLSEEEREKTAKAAEEFLSPSGAGASLQKALEVHASRENMPNWLEPFWDDSYLCSRLSLPLYSNIFYLLEAPEEKIFSGQAERAAILALRGAAFYRAIREERFPPNTERGTPLCMSQYRRVFGASRIPRENRDVLRNMISTEADPVVNPRHMVVIRKGRFYVLSLLDEEGELCPYESLRQVLEQIIRDPRPPLPDEESPGLFTTWNRDSWARARELLLEQAPEENRAFLHALEEALFVVVLDHEEPENTTALAASMLHGNGRSRWFDKTLQFIVTPRGRAAINMEHSGTDGSIMSSFAAFLGSDLSEHLSSPEGKTESLSFAELLPVLSRDARKLLGQAADAYDELCCKTAMRTLLFEDFGKDAIKSLRVSPDAFVQMALQLARYRTFGGFCTSYEPVMTRRFLHGRTEAIRTVSRQSCRFVASMEENTSLRERALALREAAEEHVRRGRVCKDGHGVDRHLYGLLQMYRRQGESLGIERLPSLFLSPGWQMLVRNVLSTSTSVSAGLELAGFGPVVDEGFGVRYLVFSGGLHFSLSSRLSLETSLERFRKELARGLREMHALLEEDSRNL
ncbi:MAG TPA: choline/carnitine O-acyltransferase, partial [Synergistaceae bacterium]|nr:choline/carnitine O-acyltransferase [Synergistaceae bacterium]